MTFKVESLLRRDSHLRPFFEVKPSGVFGAGNGLFVKKDFSAGAHLGYYTGKVLTDKQANSEQYVNSLYHVYICKDYWILGEGPNSNYTSYINHSGKYDNCRLVVSRRWKTARIEAIREIHAGEELFFNYGDEYWGVLDIEPTEYERRASRVVCKTKDYIPEAIFSGVLKSKD